MACCCPTYSGWCGTASLPGCGRSGRQLCHAQNRGAKQCCEEDGPRGVLPSSCPAYAASSSLSASKARRPRYRHAAASCWGVRSCTDSRPPLSWSARSIMAPSRVARSSPVSSTRPAFWTRPPSSMSWRVRARRSWTQSRVSWRAWARSRRVCMTLMRLSSAVAACRLWSRVAGFGFLPPLAPLLKDGLSAFGPPRYGLG